MNQINLRPKSRVLNLFEPNRSNEGMNEKKNTLEQQTTKLSLVYHVKHKAGGDFLNRISKNLRMTQ